MPEFWQEESIEDRREMRKQALRWGLLFACLLAGVFFAIWWASSAVHFSASRVEATTGPTYRVTGVVRDAGSGAGIPWAEVSDEPSGRPPIFHTTADREGVYELVTLAEPHTLQVSALGYRTARVRIGKVWYMWMPRGEESVEVKLPKE